MNGLLFASFGTSHKVAQEKHIDSVAQFLGTNMPGYLVFQAYTSSMVRRILEKRGAYVPDVAGALDSMAQQGIINVVIQPGHLLPGEEYEKLCTQAESRRSLFSSLHIAAPLLAVTKDIHTVVDVLDAQYPVKERTCVVLMGHGTPQFANTVYAAMDYRFKEIGRSDVFVGTVEAYPPLETVMRMIPRGVYSKVLLAPLMQVAGDHARNDMAGDDSGSWASQFRAAGYEVENRLVGLGELTEIQHLYLEHARAAGSGHAV